jgi:hypothetical protein
MILATQKVEMERIRVQDQSRQKKKKFSRPHLNLWLGTVL